MSFFNELKRRNVFKVAIAYVVVAWLVAQVLQLVFQSFGTPDWVMKTVLVLLATGLPFALFFAWAFEMTPEGLKREHEVDRSQSITPQTGRKLNNLIFAVMALALGYFAYDKFVLSGSRDAALVEAATQAVSEKAVTEVATAESDKSIAVLPFVNMSDDKSNEYFSDGISEELLNALAQVPDLKVAGRTSSFYFKGKDESLQAIGTALGVAYVLEGSVRKQGEEVRITAQLILVDNGFHLWSQSYDGELKDVFELQERIAREITSALKVVLVGGEEKRLAPMTTQNTEAYQQYLRGKYFFNQRGYANLQTAETAFKAALELDRDYADAWAGLALTLALMPSYSNTEAESTEWKDTGPEALAAAEQALRLQSDSSGALAARAWVRMKQFDWAGAEADYQAAIRHNPHDATARLWYSVFFMNQQNWQEAATQLDEAVAIDPLSAIIHINLGDLRCAQGDFTGALPHYDEALRLAPSLYTALTANLMCLIELGRYGPASTATQKMPDAQRKVYLSVIAALQDPSRVDEAVRQLQSHPLGGIYQVWACAKLGRNELALATLERMVREGDPDRIDVYAYPAFKPLYADPRFQALLRQMGLPEVGAENVR